MLGQMTGLITASYMQAQLLKEVHAITCGCQLLRGPQGSNTQEVKANTRSCCVMTLQCWRSCRVLATQCSRTDLRNIKTTSGLLRPHQSESCLH